MRIITGKARGTNLFTPKNYDVRPTADRVKESVFNIIGAGIIGTKVLDAFAGTGNLGLECWSRGAESVVFLDKSKESLKLVQRNIEKCHARDDCRVLQGDAVALVSRLARQGDCFDFVFLDPPYRHELISAMLKVFGEEEILHPGALIVAERSAQEDPPQLWGKFVVEREEKYSSTIIDFIRKLC